MTLNLYVSPAKIRLAFKTTFAKTGNALELVMPIDGVSVEPAAAIFGSTRAVDLFALNLAALITGDALSEGEGFPTVVDTEDLIDIYGTLRSAQTVLTGDRRGLSIPVAF